MMDACVIVTWRCPFHCKMCSIWQHPSAHSEEFAPSVLEKLPRMNAVNITGGEPFEREDLEDIVRILIPKSRRIVFSTNGWYTERIVAMARRYPEVGFRISLEGLQAANDALRGVPGGFRRGMETVRQLQEVGCQDVGVAITLSGTNHRDLLPLYRLAREKGLEFATAAAHNSFYFHKQDNVIADGAGVASALDELVGCMLAENSPKSWARAYFNNGLKGYVLGHPRPLPCRAGSSNFFVDPYANVLPCNGMAEAMVMGNLAEAASFEEIWGSPRAREVRVAVAACTRNCWMMGTASPAIKSHPLTVGGWIFGKQCERLFGSPRKGGDSCKSASPCEGGASCASASPCEGGDSCESASSCDGGDSCKSASPCDGGDSCASASSCDGGDSCKSASPCEGADSCASASSCDGGDSLEKEGSE